MKMRMLLSGIIVSVGFIVGTMGTAAAQTPAEPATSVMGPRIMTYGKIGVGGEFEGEIEEQVGGDVDVEDLDDDDMEQTNGFGAEFDYPLHKYFVLGGRLSFDWAVNDSAEDNDVERSLLLGIDVVPKGRFPLSSIPLELYLAVPLGPSITFPDDDFDQAFGPIGDIEWHAGVSWNISLLVGALYRFGPDFGAFFETGFYRQNLRFLGEGEILGQDYEGVVRGGFGQVAFMLGFAFLP